MSKQSRVKHKRDHGRNYDDHKDGRARMNMKRGNAQRMREETNARSD